jgi:hypothetical protein
VPRWNVPAIAPSASSACKHILLIGDSIANGEAADLAPIYQAHGYCATVDNEATNGSSPVSTNDGTSDTWAQRLATLLLSNTYDAVIVNFQGNGTLSTATSSNSDQVLAQNETESLAIVSTIQAAGIPQYWVEPMLSAFVCNWTAPFNLNGYQAYREWVTLSMPGVPKINGNVLTPLANPYPPDSATTYNHQMIFPDELAHTVRRSDCLHLTNDGDTVQASQIVADTTSLWPATPPTSTTTTPTTSTSTTSTTSTSTTTTTTTTTGP